MLTRLVNQFVNWVNQRRLLKFLQPNSVKSFGLLFVIGLGLSIAIASCTPNSTNAPIQNPQSQLKVLKMANQS